MNWISVNDKLPEEGQCVLIYQNNPWEKDYNILVLKYEYGAFRDVDYEDKEYGIYELVTHWMPLPKKP